MRQKKKDGSHDATRDTINSLQVGYVRLASPLLTFPRGHGVHAFQLAHVLTHYTDFYYARER